MSTYSDLQMREELERRNSQAQGVNHVLTLADIESVMGKPECVANWIAYAKGLR